MVQLARVSAAAKKERTYQDDTYSSTNRLVRYAHGTRIKTAIEMITAERARTVLDYGAGDGEMLLRLLSDPRAAEISRVIAFDPEEGFRAEMERRISTDPRVTIAATREEAAAQLHGRELDAISCLGVLEHLPLIERECFYRFCDQYLSTGGRCIIDVPVEIGGSLLIKTLGRRFAKGRSREYRLPELARSVLGMRTRDLQRMDPSADVEFIFTHKGFDHRVFRDELTRWQTVQETRMTPVRWLPSWLCNQEVFFLTRKRGKR